MTPGTKVTIKHLYAGGSDGVGVIVKPWEPIPDGYVMVLTEGMRIKVEVERIVL